MGLKFTLKGKYKMTIRNENGDRFISLKWSVGILMAALLTVMGAWAQQRYSFETKISERISVLESRQSAVIARLDANRDVLDRIYAELTEHRRTGR